MRSNCRSSEPSISFPSIAVRILRAPGQKNLGCIDAREPLESLYCGGLHKCITMAAADLPPLPANCEVLYAG